MQLSTNTYEELIDVLEREFLLCSDLVILLQKEKDVISGLDREALDAHLRDKELVSAKINVCEEVRVKMLCSIGLANKTLSEVAVIAGPDYRDRLSFIASKFKSITDSIRELNNLNSMLIEKSLFYIKSSRNFLRTFGINPKQSISMEA